MRGFCNSLNNSLAKVKTYVGEDGNLHFIDSEGADSVLPFSSGGIKGCDTLFYADSTYVNGSTKYIFNSNYKAIMYAPSRSLETTMYKHFINNTQLTTSNTIEIANGKAIHQNQSSCFIYMYIGEISSGDTFYSDEGRIATLWGIK